MKLFKKLVAVSLCLAILAGTTMSSSALLAPLRGDLDDDGRQTVADIIIMKAAIMGNTMVARTKKNADLNKDSKATVQDILLLKDDIMSGYERESVEKINIADGSSFYIESVATSHMMSTRNYNYNTIRMYLYSGTATQQWTAVKKGDYYMIRSVYNGMYWRVFAKENPGWDGDTPYLYTEKCDNVNNPGDEYLFKFDKNQDGSYNIIPKIREEDVIQIEFDYDYEETRLLVGGNDRPDKDNDRFERWNLYSADANYDEVLEDGFADKVYMNFMDNLYLLTDKGGYITTRNYFWDWAEIIEAVIDGYDQNPCDEYREMVDQCVKAFISEFGTNWRSNDFNDDIMWMVIACCRAYKATGNEQYKRIAKENFDLVYDRAWNDEFGGGLEWMTTTTSKNACVNGPGAIAATYLYELYNDRGYLTKAKEIFEWEYDVLFIKEGDDIGRILDNIDYDGDNGTKFNNYRSSYNQGTFIGAATRLYEFTKDAKYLEYAKQAADHTAFRWQRGRAMSNEGNNREDYNDAHGFKGIFWRWFGYYVNLTEDDDYDNWIAVNLHCGWQFRNSNGLVSNKWDDIDRGNRNRNYKAFWYSNYVVLAQVAPYERLQGYDFYEIVKCW